MDANYYNDEATATVGSDKSIDYPPCFNLCLVAKI